jgi:DNA-binding transcriptional regulator YiaG
MHEEWRPVLGFEGWYEVSNLAQVRRGRPGKGTLVGAIIKQSLSLRGRRQVSLSKDGQHRTLPVHVIVAHAFIGPKPTGREINHIDYDHTNNLPSNLEYVTALENIRHSYAHGHGVTAACGERNSQAKLTAEAIRDIRTSSMTKPQLAARYGVAVVTIKAVRRGRIWRHVLAS